MYTWKYTHVTVRFVGPICMLQILICNGITFVSPHNCKCAHITTEYAYTCYILISFHELTDAFLKIKRWPGASVNESSARRTCTELKSGSVRHLKRAEPCFFLSLSATVAYVFIIPSSDTWSSPAYIFL